MSLTPPTLASSPQAPLLVALAQWQVKDGRLQLVVPLTDALTPKQKSIINGGFTTVSQLTVRQPRPGLDDKDDQDGQNETDDDDAPSFYGVRCSVKFDAWEETYDVVRLDDKPRAALVKQLGEYGELCLKAEITADDVLQPLAKDGGALFAQLIVRQTSVEEASKIKEWLIQQQSGVMQSLFSHMLGELTVNQTLRMRISVPPKPLAMAVPAPAAAEASAAPKAPAKSAASPPKRSTKPVRPAAKPHADGKG